MPKKNKSNAAQKKVVRRYKLKAKIENDPIWLQSAGKGAVKKQTKGQTKSPKSGNIPPAPVARNEECADDTGIDVMDISLDKTALENKDDQHKAQLASIASMSTRVDEHIINITALQKQLSELQLKQISLLDGCVNFFHELQTFQAEDEEEEKLVLETFIELKTKVKIVFKHYLPTEIDILERDMKMLQLNNRKQF